MYHKKPPVHANSKPPGPQTIALPPTIKMTNYIPSCSTPKLPNRLDLKLSNAPGQLLVFQLKCQLQTN